MSKNRKRLKAIQRELARLKKVKEDQERNADLQFPTHHHRKPKSVGGLTNDRNISVIDRRHHAAWHTLFGNKCPDEIADIINAVYLDPDYKFICFRN